MPPRPRFDRRAPVRELPNINDRISYPQLRVVDADGSQLGVITREAALEVAKDRELDLVLVSEKADPPVCRIMDYGKYKFEQEKKAKEAKKKSHQTEVKEVKTEIKATLEVEWEVALKKVYGQARGEGRAARGDGAVIEAEVVNPKAEEKTES